METGRLDNKQAYLECTHYEKIWQDYFIVEYIHLNFWIYWKHNGDKLP